MPTPFMINLPPPNSWEELEQLSWDLFRAEWEDPNITRNGRQGQEQDGVDIYGRRNGRGGFIGVQCKLHGPRAQLRFDEVTSEITKAEGFSPTLTEFVMVTTAPRDARLQRKVRTLSHEREGSGRFPIYVRFWDDITTHLAVHWDVAQRHYPQFFITQDVVSEQSKGQFTNGEGEYKSTNKLRVFISSRINAGLNEERLAVVGAVEGTGMAEAWYWERDGYASAEGYQAVCRQHVRASDALTMLVGEDLSVAVEDEYQAASIAGRPRYVFIKDDCEHSVAVKHFLDKEQRSVTTRHFRNQSELRSHVVDALSGEITQLWRARWAPSPECQSTIALDVSEMTAR